MKVIQLGAVKREVVSLNVWAQRYLAVHLALDKVKCRTCLRFHCLVTLSYVRSRIAVNEVLAATIAYHFCRYHAAVHITKDMM